MAHCTHSSPTDLALLSSTGTSIAHCPLSNVYFSAERQLPLREALEAGVKVGLGSDVSGGYRVGIDESARWAVGVHRLREGQRELHGRGKDESSLAMSWQEALFLSTLGGAQALGLDVERMVGSLEVGWAFDAQLIEVGGKGSRIDWFEFEGRKVATEEKVERWFANGTEVDRKAVWVQGRKVYEQAA
jgi:guanine deaminase